MKKHVPIGSQWARRGAAAALLVACAQPALANDLDLHSWWVDHIGGPSAAIPAGFDPGPWTFRSTVTGPFIGPGIQSNVFGDWTSVGMVGGVYSAGQLACAACVGTLAANTQARFDGVFVHPGAYPGYDPVIRYTFASAATVGSLDLWAEAVADSRYGNGMTAFLSHHVAGATVNDGAVDASYGYRVGGGNANLHVDFAAPLSFQAGDYVELQMADNGSVLWDHTGVNLRINPAAAVITSSVPEPETYALMLAGLCAMGWIGRRTRRAAR